MKRLLKPINNQNGSMILVALMLLVILTVMGITSTSTSIVENRITVNEQLHKTAFYHADSGLYAAAKIVGATIDEWGFIPSDNFEFEYAGRYGTGPSDEDFVEYISDPDAYDDGEWDIRFLLENAAIRVDIEPLDRALLGPAGVIEGLGGMGEAARGALDIPIYFRMFSEGRETRRNSLSTLSGTYEKFLGRPGGL